MSPPYLELHLHTPYSFRDGGSAIESLVTRAAELGMPALAMTDHDNTAASVKFATACHAYGIKPILGAEITMEDSSHLTLLARNRQGYVQLCTLTSRAYMHGGRLTPALAWSDLYGGVEVWRCGGVQNGQLLNAVCKSENGNRLSITSTPPHFHTSTRPRSLTHDLPLWVPQGTYSLARRETQISGS